MSAIPLTVFQMSVLLLKYLIIKKLLKRFGCDYFTQDASIYISNIC